MGEQQALSFGRVSALAGRSRDRGANDGGGPAEAIQRAGQKVAQAPAWLAVRAREQPLPDTPDEHDRVIEASPSRRVEKRTERRREVRRDLRGKSLQARR